jgi:glutamyl-tRNA reductase
VLGQVRDAFEAAQQMGLSGSNLDLVLEEVLRIAARVHRATGVGTGRVSLAEIAVDRVRSRLRRTPGATVLVGVSPMTIRCARALAPEGQPLVFVNRTVARAEEAARDVGAEALSLEAYRQNPVPAEAIILATASPVPVLGRPELERLAARSASGEPPLIVDLAVPPDVDPEDARAIGLPRIGMEEVIAEAESNRNHRLLELSEARTIVDDALVGLRRRLADRLLAPTLAALHRRFRRTALEGVERLLRKSMKDLSNDEQDAIRQWAETLARRFAYVPSAGLRSLAYNNGAEGVRAFLDGLDEGMARELRNDAADLDDLRCDPEAAF